MSASSIDPDFGTEVSAPLWCFQRSGTCMENPDPVCIVALFCISTCVPGRIEQLVRKNKEIKRILNIKNN